MSESIWFTDSLMRVHVAPEDTAGTYALLEALVPPGHVTPAHVHHDASEGLFVLEGEITLVTAAGERVLLPGEATHVPAGEPHEVRVTGSGTARVVLVSPAEVVEHLRVLGRPAERDALPTIPVEA